MSDPDDRAYCRRHRQNIVASDGCPDCDAEDKPFDNCMICGAAMDVSDWPDESGSEVCEKCQKL